MCRIYCYSQLILAYIELELNVNFGSVLHRDRELDSKKILKISSVCICVQFLY